MEGGERGSSRDGVLLRSYEPGDEHAIADLFERCFGKPLSLEHWYWKYTKNPYGNHTILVAAKEGAIVAHYGGYPVYMHDGPDRKVRSLHIGDIMTDPQVRGLGIGHRSVIARVTRAFYGRFCEGKVAFNFGAPAGRHLRLGRMVMRYEAAGPVLLWSREGTPAPGSNWLRALQRVKWRGAAIEEADRIGVEEAELYDRVKGRLGISLSRDAAYLRWRYQFCPGKSYRFYRVAKKNVLILWAVVAKEKDQILLGDVIVAPENGSILALFAEEMARRWPGLPVRMWSPASPTWWTEMLSGAGFRSAPHPWGISAGLTIFDEAGYSVGRMSREWFYAMGDFDLF